MAAVEHSAVHPVGVQMLLGDRYPGCAARPWATMFNRVAVVVRAIAKFWNLELGTWNLEPGTSTWVAGRSQRRACIMTPLSWAWSLRLRFLVDAPDLDGFVTFLVTGKASEVGIDDVGFVEDAFDKPSSRRIDVLHRP